MAGVRGRGRGRGRSSRIHIGRGRSSRIHIEQYRALANVRTSKMALFAHCRQHDADSLLPDLLLSINAIASGLRTTG